MNPAELIINSKSLKDQVYAYLKEEIHRHRLQPGAIINMDATARKLGISKTPLRDALIQLEMDGFVTIKPRRGIFVNSLSLSDISHFYQVIGALERAAILACEDRFESSLIDRMAELNGAMEKAIGQEDYQTFYQNNLNFHDTYIDACANPTLKRTVDNLKKRLYEFPQQDNWIKEWEESSIKEHRQLIELLRTGDFQQAARFVQEIHWSYVVQERFILLYYSNQEKNGGSVTTG